MDNGSVILKSMKKGYNIKDLTPAYAIHPGEILFDKLESRKINPEEFAIKIGKPNEQLSKLLEGKIDISSHIATLIGNELKMDIEIWLRLKNIIK